MFPPNHVKTTIRPHTITTQDAGIYSNAELDHFWNRILFLKHSDTTLHSFLMILQTILMLTFLKQIHKTLFVLDYMKKSENFLLFYHHGLLMRS